MAYQFFYNGTMRSISIALLNIIKDIQVYNFDTSGNAVKQIPLVIQFSVPEKDYYFKLIQNVWTFENIELNERYYVSKPRINLRFENMNYDSKRQCDGNSVIEFFKNSIETSGVNATSAITNINPTPYNFDYTLEIKTESYLHLSEILEQFLVFFNPCVQLQVKEFSNINISRDLKCSITGISFTINEDLDSNGYKQCDCSIGLQVEGNLYRPLSNTSIIKTITTNYYTTEDPSIVTSASS
jgi:hypothetical protein